MKKVDLILFLVALGFGLLMAVSLEKWSDAADRGRAETEIAKRELLASAGLFQLHHKVYAEVGERVWEDRVKPEFLGAITRETIRDTGDLFPDWRSIVSWVRKNPERARELLRQAARAD